MKQDFTHKGLSRLYLIMRVSFVNLLLLVIPCLQVLSAKPVCGQNMHDTFVRINVEHVPLKDIFNIIEDQTELLFVYSPELIEAYNDVTLKDDHVSVGAALHEILRDLPIAFKESGDNILLFKKEIDNVEQTTIISVEGKVVGTNGEPLPGVNVVVKGTTIGTTTDYDGRYVLKERNEEDVLLFSFIGFKPMEVPIGTQTTIDVTLMEDVSTLKEVVVKAGYYDVEKWKNTGSISSISADVIAKQPVTNVLGTLQGRTTGVFIQQASGIPGGEFKIQIRGRNSLRSDGNEPLYIVDGVPFSTEKTFSYYTSSGGAFDANNPPDGGSKISPLTSLNPADIESIEILKDADATAIYGSRGANGVVLITTKKGKAGKTKFDLNVYTGVGNVRKLKFLNTPQYLAIRREAFANDGLIPSADRADDGSAEKGYRLYAPDLMVWDTTKYTDWQDVFLGSAQTTSVQSSISGGSEQTQFMFSAGYRRENSVYPGDLGYQKGSFHLSTNHRSGNKKFNINVNISGAKDKNNQPALGLIGARNRPPNAPDLYKPDGTLNWDFGDPNVGNPLADLEIKYTNSVVSFIGNSVVGYEIVKGLQVKSSFGINYMHSDEINKKPSTYFNPALNYTSEESEVRDASGTNQSWSIEPQVVYDKAILKGKLNALVGMTFQEQQLERKANYYKGFPSDALMANLSSAIESYNLENVESLYRYAAIFARINYNWKDKYILNLTARRDGSSRFGPRRRFSNFGAVGMAWIFSEERFVTENLPFISFGKLRTSYGQTGNDQIGDYRYLDTYAPGSVGGNQYQGISILSPTKLFNADYAWEVNRKYEAALELGFLNDRITASVNYFRNRSSNQLVQYTLPTTTGFNGILANLPATVQNTGVEIELSTTNVDSKGITWITSFNLTIPKNRLVSFPGIESSSYATQYVIGKPLSIAQYYRETGVDPQSGIWTFEDVNGDGEITIDDRKEMVFLGQNFFGGLSNSISFKRVSIDFLWQFVKQNGIGPAIASGYPGKMQNVPEFVISQTRWRREGDRADLQRLSVNNSAADNAYGHYRESDAGLVDASFIRLTNVSVSYSLPARIAKGTACRFYFQGQNLLLITDYEGSDPENQQFMTLPPLRMFTAGFQLTL